MNNESTEKKIKQIIYGNENYNLLYDEKIYLNEGLKNVFKQPLPEEFKSGWEKEPA
jgi:hypothetical protein